MKFCQKRVVKGQTAPGCLFATGDKEPKTVCRTR